MTRVCSLDDCSEPHIALGYCQNHYRVFKRRGTPTPPRREPKVFVAKGGYLYRSINQKTTYLHIAIAEKAMGGPLPIGAEVHHVDGNPANNAPENLVICPDHRYHSLLHQRQRALDACGHAHWRPCRICGQYDDPKHMRPHYHQFYHRACNADASRRRRQKLKETQQ